MLLTLLVQLGLAAPCTWEATSVAAPLELHVNNRHATTVYGVDTLKVRAANARNAWVEVHRGGVMVHGSARADELPFWSTRPLKQKDGTPYEGELRLVDRKDDGFTVKTTTYRSLENPVLSCDELTLTPPTPRDVQVPEGPPLPEGEPTVCHIRMVLQPPTGSGAAGQIDAGTPYYIVDHEDQQVAVLAEVRDIVPATPDQFALGRHQVKSCGKPEDSLSDDDRRAIAPSAADLLGAGKAKHKVDPAAESWAGSAKDVVYRYTPEDGPRVYAEVHMVDSPKQAEFPFRLYGAMLHGAMGGKVDGKPLSMGDEAMSTEEVHDLLTWGTERTCVELGHPDGRKGYACVAHSDDTLILLAALDVRKLPKKGALDAVWEPRMQALDAFRAKK